MMTNKWLMGTAVAALVSTGAIAQDVDLSAADECRLIVAASASTGDELEARFAEFDTDGDQRISREEYAACLEARGIQLDEVTHQAYMDEFDRMDTTGDGHLMFADIETAAMDEARAEGSDVAVDQQSAKITVTQPAAKVTVREAQADVVVRQSEPTVEVEQKQPEVAVSQPQPQVTVQQPEAQVSVTQPEATVSVEQPEPEVTVTQQRPEVQVTPGQPRVAVETAQPEVQVSQPQPEVAVSQPQPEVEVRTAEPEVVVQDAQPDVEIQQTTDVDAEVATGERTAMTAGTQQSEGVQRVTTTEADATVVRIAYDELDGRDVYNANGEDIGEIEDIRLDPRTNRPVVVIEVGGFLGIGRKEYVFDYDELTITEDRIVLNTSLSGDQLADQIEYDEARYQDLPPEMLR